METTKSYNHRAIEEKWQKRWRTEKTYEVDLVKAKKPFYNLMMFPYPSAEGLHVGNMYAFTGADVYGRYQRMKGYDVFEPIGLDGFGIHSENYAIKIGKHPKEQAKISESHFYEQLARIGNGFAWDQRLETYDPDYYRWTQWLFVQMYKHGLAFRKKARVNWCPSCKTVLADEQVEDGRCERCKNETTYKDLAQWFFKITDYADRLLVDIEGLKWPKKIKVAQKQWIGKKEGLNIHYPIEGMDDEVVCFTTRPDTNFGATFIVIGPEHQLLNKIADKVSPVIKYQMETYVKQALAKTENERIAEGRVKTGVFTGLYAINRLNGYRMPIYVSDFVLGHVGTGAVVGVPGHDRRDFQFAKTMNLPVVRVVLGRDNEQAEIKTEAQVMEGEGKMINSDFLNGMEVQAAIDRMIGYHEEKGWGKRVFDFHLRDWLVSRQRYWGAPIPMIFCKSCDKWFPEKNLPVILPELTDWQPKGDGRGPLENAPEAWLYTKCPECGGKAKRETDVCDTFLDSSWYFLRYPSIGSKSEKLPWDMTVTEKWLPVNAYIGGAEHAVLHLLYSRFVYKALLDWELLPSEDKREPFPFLYGHGLIIKDGAKMSKSRGNIVNPDEYLDKYGADVLRMYLMFIGPYDQGGDFKDTGMEGMKRFLNRVWQMMNGEHWWGETTSKKLVEKLNETVIRMDQDLAEFRYNTAIAALMELINTWREQITMSKTDRLTVVKLMAPLAPHMAEELWERMMNQPTFAKASVGKSVHWQQYPVGDAKKVSKPLVIVVQVNGKVRQVLSGQGMEIDEVEVKARALAEPKINKWLEGKQVVRTIWLAPTAKRQGLLNLVVL